MLPRKKWKAVLIHSLSLYLIATLLFSNFIVAFAEPSDLDEESLARKELPIQSNQLEGWPTGPEISAQSAILMEADTGTILYAKNIHEKNYPASTTKMLTCLLAAENSSLDEMVDFSYEVVSSIPYDGSSMGIDAGESLPMEECLYGIMVASANEVASAVAEHVGGTVPDFVDMMNNRAKSLGCTESHFVNSNGLYDDDHYTSAHDLALIARAFFQNDVLRRIGNTPKYHFIPTETQPDDFYKTNKHQLITGDYPYDGIIGGKTGYTDIARQTLVTGCEQNGMRLICVVMKEESPLQFEDTASLFDYGYQNFTKVNVAENDTHYIIDDLSFFHTGNDIFGNSSTFLTLAKNDFVILPNLCKFEDLDTKISYDDPTLNDFEIARLSYFYHSVPVGIGTVLLSREAISKYDFTPVTEEEVISGKPDNVIFINVKFLLSIVIGVAAFCIFIVIIHSLFFGRNNTRQERKRRQRLKRDARIRNRERKRNSRIDKKRIRKLKRGRRR